jgi:hypothetical protein
MGDDGILKYGTDFYKNLLGDINLMHVSLSEQLPECLIEDNCNSVF